MYGRGNNFLFQLITLYILNNFTFFFIYNYFIQNTPESFKFALEIWKYSNHHGIRTRSIMANLALKQNSPEVALNALHSGPMEQVISIRSLKILIYAQLERYIQIIPMLKFILDKDLKSYVVFQDVVC